MAVCISCPPGYFCSSTTREGLPCPTNRFGGQTDGCLDRALAIVFAHEARCLALLDVQKKPLDDLKNSLELIYDKGHCYIYTYRCDLRFILFIPKITKDLLGEMISRSYGHIVNVVSSRALRENAFSSFYSSSTAALFTTAVLIFYLDGGIYTILRKYVKEKVLLVTLELFCETPRAISSVFHIRISSRVSQQIKCRFVASVHIANIDSPGVDGLENIPISLRLP
ncbi:unnamed protein product [Rotaria sordida]|uniref:Uncharacterized protein n=1 Tax=Rotaria sordida TaxID=392033 RepID=A0A818L0Y6_9BILA|nr:unnamed protein product [Rotaria sordida]